MSQSIASLPLYLMLKMSDPTASSVDFVTLVLSMRENALHLLGHTPEDAVQETASDAPVDLDGARVQIDMLDVVRKRTVGNLDEEEQRLIDTVLYELRFAWVERNRETG